MIERRFSGSAPTVRAGTARSASAPSTISGYAAIYNSETVIGGFFRERIAPGAFSDAVERDDVRALFNHDPNIILGRTKSGTLHLSSDAKGLRYGIDVNPDDTQALDIAARIKRGDVSGSSFAFVVHEDDERWTYDNARALPLRTILRATLIDVSPVTFPAYEATSVSVRERAAAADQLRLLRARVAIAKTRARFRWPQGEKSSHNPLWPADAAIVRLASSQFGRIRCTAGRPVAGRRSNGGAPCRPWLTRTGNASLPEGSSDD
jgi:uncharacterized protein